MNDPLLMRRFEGICDLSRDRQRLDERDRPARDPLREILAVDELEHERGNAARLFEPVDVGDVRMIERRQHLRFAAEPRETIRIIGNGWQQHLDRDVAIQLGIARAKYFAHSTRAERRDDVVGSETGSDKQWHDYLVTGTRAFSSSNQLSTIWICGVAADAEPVWSHAFNPSRPVPSGLASYGRVLVGFRRAIRAPTDG